jgi:hypothetical protein
LLYLLEMGPIEQTLIRQAIQAGQPIPDRIENAPELELGLNLYLIAFFDLDSERSHSFGYTRIPWSSIQDYAAANEFDGYQTECLNYFIRKMDSANAERLDKEK